MTYVQLTRMWDTCYKVSSSMSQKEAFYLWREIAYFEIYIQFNIFI